VAWRAFGATFWLLVFMGFLSGCSSVLGNRAEQTGPLRHAPLAGFA
jgi:uncharacterized protein YceK